MAPRPYQEDAHGFGDVMSHADQAQMAAAGSQRDKKEATKRGKLGFLLSHAQKAAVSAYSTQRLLLGKQAASSGAVGMAEVTSTISDAETKSKLLTQTRERAVKLAKVQAPRSAKVDATRRLLVRVLPRSVRVATNEPNGLTEVKHVKARAQLQPVTERETAQLKAPSLAEMSRSSRETAAGDLGEAERGDEDEHDLEDDEDGDEHDHDQDEDEDEDDDEDEDEDTGEHEEEDESDDDRLARRHRRARVIENH